jgi:hypothetical protein
LARRDRRRLDFEAMRDSLLLVGGGLDRTIGGPSIKITEQGGSARRSVYAYIDRQNLPNVFRAFDFASPDTHAPKRYETITPQQALFLLNNPFTLSQARQIGSSIFPANPANEAELRASVTALYRRVLARDATSDELQAAVDFVVDEQQHAAAGQWRESLTAGERLAHVLLLSNEFVMLD